MYVQKNKQYGKLNIVVIFVSVFIILALLYQIKIQDREIALLDKELLRLHNEVLEKDDQISALMAEIRELSEEQKTLSSSYDELLSDTEETIELIDKYELEIQESMDWFNENSDLTSLNTRGFEQNYERVDSLLKSCYTVDNNECTIRTACLYLVNGRLSLDYKSDEITSDSVDKMQSIYDFYRNHGGDCEDYSLFYKVQFNHVRENCYSEGANKIILETWYVPESIFDSEPVYWLDNKEEWYLENVAVLDFSDVPYPSIVCGGMYDFQIDGVGGHCVLAFTEEPISDENDIHLLSGALLIEPQDGHFMGHLDMPSSDIYLVEHGSEYYIDTVVTDNDLISYSSDYDGWISYSALLQELYDRKLQITKFLHESELDI